MIQTPYSPNFEHPLQGDAPLMFRLFSLTIYVMIVGLNIIQHHLTESNTLVYPSIP